MAIEYVVFALFFLTTSVVIEKDDLDEAQLVTTIGQFGGTVARDKSLPNHPITSISFRMNHKCSDKALALLPSLPQLRELDLCGTSITDAGLKFLGELRVLMILDLTLKLMTDSGVYELGGLEKLTSAKAPQGSLTDDELRPLVQHADLTRLDVAGRFTDVGAKEIARLTKLTSLSVME